jgi:hypothetical protein
MNLSIKLVVAGLALSMMAMGAVQAAAVSKEEVKSTCSTAGGTYTEGSNYGRCEYSNGDSYTCNTDVNQCESCTNGKCTVSIKRPGIIIKKPPATQKAR